MKNSKSNDEIQNVLQDTAEDLKNLARAEAKLLEARASEAVEQGADFVRKHPLATVAGAFALGYLIAKMGRSKK